MCFLIQQKACIKMQIEIKEIIMIVTIILTALMVGALIGYFFFIESHIGDKCEKCHKRKVFPKSSIKIGTRDIMRDSVTKKTTKDKRGNQIVEVHHRQVPDKIDEYEDEYVCDACGYTKIVKSSFSTNFFSNYLEYNKKRKFTLITASIILAVTLAGLSGGLIGFLNWENRPNNKRMDEYLTENGDGQHVQDITYVSGNEVSFNLNKLNGENYEYQLIINYQAPSIDMQGIDSWVFFLILRYRIFLISFTEWIPPRGYRKFF